MTSESHLQWLRKELEELAEVAERSRVKADARNSFVASASYNGEWLGLTHALDRIADLEDRDRMIACCWRCRDAANPPLRLGEARMMLCSECGNKRCPKASDHRLDCTNSNEPGQKGSMYT